MERYTKRLDDGQAVMDCQNCPVSWVNEPNSDCTALYCRNRLKDRVAAIEDILGDYGLDRLRELVEADLEGRCSISPKLVCMDEVTTPTPEQYRWMMGRFLKGEQDG